MANTRDSTISLQKMQYHQGHLAADHLTQSTATATIDLDALRHNLGVVKRQCPHQKVMAMVKSRAYGHGLVSCARALSDADGFGVACLNEALALRRAGLTKPIFLVSGFHHADEIAAVVEHDITAIIHSSWQIDALEQAEFSQPIKIWMKIDSGMGRLGFAAEVFQKEYQRLRAIAGVHNTIGVITHLSSADDVDDPTTHQQIETYRKLTKDIIGPKSIANSAGILHWPQAVENTDWVRPGIMLYGVAPNMAEQGKKYDLRPVMTVYAQVLAVKQMKKGDPVGYSHTWSCPEDMTVAVLAYGYGDGLPRTASGLGVTHANGQAPIVGRVSMDLSTIDCRGLSDIQPGDEVILWGEGGDSIETVATEIGDFTYEMLTNVSGRVRRIYTEA
ncbi:MAG: alanine racemase [Coxiellaceae bacterium]|nr:alanine racemase [Coxiellaceae bacterium]